MFSYFLKDCKNILDAKLCNVQNHAFKITIKYRVKETVIVVLKTIMNVCQNPTGLTTSQKIKLIANLKDKHVLKSDM